jgi:predicted nucleic acid-binding protein
LSAALLIVLADTGPLHYLVLIGESGILPQLFTKILIPDAVRDELLHPEAPSAVRDWAANPPDWLEVHASPSVGHDDPELQRLDRGERAALALAEAVGADLLLMDDREGVAAARSKGYAVTGTLGVLDLAARRDMIDLDAVVTRLRATNFRYRPEMLNALLARMNTRRRGANDGPRRSSRRCRGITRSA